jgi:hypothetical protein
VAFLALRSPLALVAVPSLALRFISTDSTAADAHTAISAWITRRACLARRRPGIIGPSPDLGLLAAVHRWSHRRTAGR